MRRLRCRWPLIRFGRSMWLGYGLHFIDGRKYPPLLVRTTDDGLWFGKGCVLAVGPFMAWVQIPLVKVEVPRG